MSHLKGRRWAVLLTAVLAGCSSADGDAGRVDVYEVTGKVTFNGAPVAGASVSFSPIENQPAAFGRTDTSGNYTLTTYEGGDGAAAGKYVALISKDLAPVESAPVAHGADGKFTPPAHSGPRTRAANSTAALPAKYSKSDQSGLEATVSADGENKFDFDLKP